MKQKVCLILCALISLNFLLENVECKTNPEPQGNPQNLNRLLQFVVQHNAQHCLARVICELSANPNRYGQDGLKFGTSLL